MVVFPSSFCLFTSTTRHQDPENDPYNLLEGEETDDEVAKVQCDLDEDRAEMIQEAENAIALQQDSKDVEMFGGATLPQFKTACSLYHCQLFSSTR